MGGFFNSKYFFWLILALPAIGMSVALFQGNSPEPDTSAVEFFIHPTGEFSARFMIIAMMLTPLRMLMPRAGVWKWLMKRRRYLGVAAFMYGLYHTVLYCIHTGTFSKIVSEVGQLEIWTGWLAFLIFIPLAITSNNFSVKKMGLNWKRLQQAVYIAAILTLIHWIFIHNTLGSALAHFLPLAVLEVYRLAKKTQRGTQNTKPI